MCQQKEFLASGGNWNRTLNPPMPFPPSAPLESCNTPSHGNCWLLCMDWVKIALWGWCQLKEVDGIVHKHFYGEMAIEFNGGKIKLNWATSVSTEYNTEDRKSVNQFCLHIWHLSLTDLQSVANTATCVDTNSSSNCNTSPLGWSKKQCWICPANTKDCSLASNLRAFDCRWRFPQKV